MKTDALTASVAGQQVPAPHTWGLKPPTVQTWKLSTDPQFVDKVHDMVGLYLNPPDNALVLAGGREQPDASDRPPRSCRSPTTPGPVTHDHIRHGTASLFAALGLGSGSVIAQHCRRRRHSEPL